MTRPQASTQLVATKKSASMCQVDSATNFNRFDPDKKSDSQLVRQPLMSLALIISQDSTVTSGIDSTQGLNEEKVHIPPLESTTQQSQRNGFSLKKHWYYDIMQRLEELNWSYQNLEVEYSFLEKLMAEQKEDLKKAKNWSKNLPTQNAASNRANKAH